MLAVTMQRRGFKTAILDADITGPSIPKCFGIHEKAMGSDDGLFPVNTKTGIETMSINELLPDETSPGRLARPGHRRCHQAVLERRHLE